MAIYIRPFKASDLKAFVPIEPMGEDKLLEMAEMIEESNLAVTGIREGKIVGCGGVHPIDDIHGELWLRLSDTCRKYPFDTLRWLKSGMEIIEQTFPFRQLNAAVRCGHKRGKKLVEWLGLKQVEIKDGYAIYAKLVGN